MSDKKNEVNYISILNAVSCLAVTFMHANECFWKYSTERYWFTANIIESLFYFAVPVFFMISGATLLDYRERYDTKLFFKKRFSKTLIPFLVWSVIGIFYLLISPEYTIDDKRLTPFGIVDGIINTKYITIYWFFPAIMSVYLCMPLLTAVEKGIKQKIYGYACAVLFFVLVLFPFIVSVFSIPIDCLMNTGISVRPITASGLLVYLLYVMMGYLISKNEIRGKYEVAVYILSAAGLLMQIIGTYVLSTRAGAVVTTYKGYFNFPCFIYSAGIFLFIKNHSGFLRGKYLAGVISLISRYSFGIYLMHCYFLDIFGYLYGKILGIPENSIIFRLSAPLVVIAVCVMIIFVLRKIPVIRRIVP